MNKYQVQSPADLLGWLVYLTVMTSGLPERELLLPATTNGVARDDTKRP